MFKKHCFCSIPGVFMVKKQEICCVYYVELLTSLLAVRLHSLAKTEFKHEIP